MGRKVEGLHANPWALVSALQAFSGRETTLTGGSRTPARAVSAHSGLFSPGKIVHGVGTQPRAGLVCPETGVSRSCVPPAFPLPQEVPPLKGVTKICRRRSSIVTKSPTVRKLENLFELSIKLVLKNPLSRISATGVILSQPETETTMQRINGN